MEKERRRFTRKGGNKEGKEEAEKKEEAGEGK